MRLFFTVLAFGLVVALVGCDMELPENRRNVDPGMVGVSMDTPETLAEPDGPADDTASSESDAAESDVSESDDAGPSEESRDQDRDSTSTQTDGERPRDDRRTVRAEAGVGEKGRGYGDDIITKPVSQYFGMRQKITFLNIQNAIKTYEALHGHAPKSHDEFMKEIIQTHRIDLPSLPPGDEYFYDPQKKALFVKQRR